MSYYDEDKPSFGPKTYAITGTTLAAAGLAGFAMYRYKVCHPHEYLVRSGLGIKNVLVTKQGFQWPFQKFNMISMRPRTYEFNLHNMSNEMLEFMLPCAATICPIDPQKDMTGFVRYANYMNESTDEELIKTITSIIKGEVRSLTTTLTANELFTTKEKFKNDVAIKIDKDLNQFGLFLANLSFQDMDDVMEGSEYFKHRRKKAAESAIQESEIDVAQARKLGKIGVSERDRDARIKTAEFEKEAKLEENKQNQEVANSNAQLAKVQAEASRIEEVARIEAQQAAEIRKIELEKTVSERKKAQQLEELKSIDLVKATVAKESTVEQAKGEAEAIRLIAEANLFAKLKEAEGIEAVFNAQGKGLEQVLKAADNNPDLAKFHLANESKLYPKLAEENAKAVSGLKPKINIWNTTTDGNSSDPLSSILRVAQGMAPMLDGLDGKVDMPTWLPHKPKEIKQMEE